MHVAAANPSYLERSQVPAAELEHEKEVLSEQAKNEGKPEKIIEKMVMGRINKYYKEVCLVDQEFVKDPDQTVGKLVKAAGAEVLAFSVSNWVKASKRNKRTSLQRLCLKLNNPFSLDCN